ncbi:MAG: FimV/HubP family polar landmark protein, partial [Gammaproteobacteria bacterium]
RSVQIAAVGDRKAMEYFQHPYVSAMLDGCMEKGKDYVCGGAKYNLSSITAYGFATLADSLYCIKKMVYQDKSISLPELIAVLNSDFADQEVIRQKLISRYDKWGNDKVEIDASQRLMDINRLNNTSGLLPEMDFVFMRPQSNAPPLDAYLWEGWPLVFYNDIDKLKAGFKMEGSYLDMDQPSTPASSAETESSEDMGLDFSLDMDSSTSSPEAEPALDFNLDSLPADDTAGGGLDFNLDTGGEASAETPATHDDLDLNLNLDEGNEPTATDIKLGMEDEDASAAGLDFDFSESTAGGGNGAGGTDMNLDASDTSMSLDMSGGGDEVGTKLDLARAYIDMGDPDGARSILDEVLEEGNDGQKQEAQQLMTQIG